MSWRANLFTGGPRRRHAWRSVWTVLHDVVAHPFAGLCWILGLQRAGDWLHEATLPPMKWSDIEFYKKQRAPDSESPVPIEVRPCA